MSDINITPLLDLAWVLLVIFIITTTAMVQGIELKLPEATPHETEMETNTPTISVKKGGDVYMDEERVKLSELEKLIRDLGGPVLVLLHLQFFTAAVIEFVHGGPLQLRERALAKNHQWTFCL